jgi:hypothetical protein
MKILEKIFFVTVILSVILALALLIVSKLKYGEIKNLPEDSVSPSVTSTATSTALSKEREEYVACGCGCCGGTDPKEQCLSLEKGEDLEKIKQDDLRIAQDSGSCALAGCSRGIRYRYCD